MLLNFGFSESLRRELEAKSANPDAADTVVEASRKLLAIFQTIVDVSDAARGTLEPSFAPIDVGPIVKRALEVHLASARRKNVAPKLYLQNSLPRINGDKYRIAHMLDHLIGNAVKFSVDGGKIIVSAVYLDGEVVLSVRDFGIGMAAEQVARALEPLSRLREDPSRALESIGPGLTIARIFAEMNGGRLDIDSAIGEGTTVRIHVPASSPARDSIAA